MVGGRLAGGQPPLSRDFDGGKNDSLDKNVPGIRNGLFDASIRKYGVTSAGTYHDPSYPGPRTHVAAPPITLTANTSHMLLKPPDPGRSKLQLHDNTSRSRPHATIEIVAATISGSLPPIPFTFRRCVGEIRRASRRHDAAPKIECGLQGGELICA